MTEPTGWHLKKEVNVSLIISVVGIAVACVTGYTNLQKDIALIQADLVSMHVKDRELTTIDDRNLETVRVQYNRLENKLDRLIERQK
jgi:predicted component of type VI protein secretion system